MSGVSVLTLSSLHARSLSFMKQADDYIGEWSEEAWILMVETATVNRDKTITFKFVNGKEIQV